MIWIELQYIAIVCLSTLHRMPDSFPPICNWCFIFFFGLIRCYVPFCFWAGAKAGLEPMLEGIVPKWTEVNYRRIYEYRRDPGEEVLGRSVGMVGSLTVHYKQAGGPLLVCLLALRISSLPPSSSSLSLFLCPSLSLPPSISLIHTHSHSPPSLPLCLCLFRFGMSMRWLIRFILIYGIPRFFSTFEFASPWPSWTP